MTTCSNCGLEIEPLEIIRVVGEDGAQHEIYVCDACIDACTPEAPGNWFILEDSGKRVRWKFWPCENCSGVYDTVTMRHVVDSDEERKMWVCPMCALELENGWAGYGYPGDLYE
jgi:protein-arginine kinase activator protein McsA